MGSTLTSMPQVRYISQTSAPSQSGLQQLSHINPELISRFEKQLAAQGKSYLKIFYKINIIEISLNQILNLMKL